MSKLATAVSNGVKNASKRKKAGKKVRAVPAKAATRKGRKVPEPVHEKPAPLKRGRHQWYVTPEGEKKPTGGPFPNWHEAFESVGYLKKGAGSLGAGCYRIKVGGKKFIVAYSAENALKAGIELPTS